MPDTIDTGTPLTPAQLAACLAGAVHGPYRDRDTGDAAGLAAEAIVT